MQLSISLRIEQATLPRYCLAQHVRRQFDRSSRERCDGRHQVDSEPCFYQLDQGARTRQRRRSPFASHREPDPGCPHGLVASPVEGAEARFQARAPQSASLQAARRDNRSSASAVHVSVRNTRSCHCTRQARRKFTPWRSHESLASRLARTGCACPKTEVWSARAVRTSESVRARGRSARSVRDLNWSACACVLSRVRERQLHHRAYDGTPIASLDSRAASGIERVLADQILRHARVCVRLIFLQMSAINSSRYRCGSRSAQTGSVSQQRVAAYAAVGYSTGVLPS
jgi:hypothetical protein